MIVDAVTMSGISPSQVDATPALPAGDFSQILEGGLRNVNAALEKADGMLKSYASGGDVAVHDLVIAMEEARVSLQLAAEVRNRVVEAYQEFMRMQL